MSGTLPCQRLALRRVAEDPELVPQPLDRRAGHGDGTLQGVHRRLVAQLVGHRGDEPAPRPHHRRAGVEQEEVAGAVGVLRLSWLEAQLADTGGLLVTQVTRQRHLAAEGAGIEGAAVGVRGGRRPDLRQHLAGDAEEAEELVVPVQRLQAHEHGAGRVGRVGDVHSAGPAPGEVPQQPAVRGAERDAARLGGVPQAVDVLQQPLQLSAGEVGRRRQPRLLADHLAAPVALQLRRDAVGAGVLPHDRVVVRPARSGIPDHGGLPLVGDAYRGEVGGREAGGVQRDLDDVLGAPPDLERVVLDPARRGEGSAGARAGGRRPRTPVIEDHEPRARGSLIDRTDEFGHGYVLRPGGAVASSLAYGCVD